ncbi:bifunctional phosphopantothenoylcysteine decarboxylase/phosphopantothenate--cysteine ligase CoaBC [Belliella kenyensis]|uniref:Coenzyme A biosynthesis bifunctional protein CoaBC n=1 Tax=Belliella kenyensis TaxID=1472724 RepID=A0ABV8EJM7_9BACT|nr:bifunctional phosphopantothenoylcysteine decarboxylase/phosphopantothenate--cysteine ligase CoaBC [Belliella kenyensis]MCH7402714.1 bifunctional phosphopantothenoylcysteine decarboxylase/phosphopantothenate--cysteine ligase CoaBC [Belliella kenyensis]MDN3603738.1 bifunctional phosphopantothenoylcysteine decarboxylase/phosphopantothenate--cysteine ligase CoaBC [Belliella kenyensis]
MKLKGKRILLGISGSIAAYKAANLTRLLIKEGAEVQVIASSSALTFITPLTLATLSKNPVLSTFEKNDNGAWNNHVELGLWADIFIIAPITANTLAKFAHGLCDNLLSAVYLSARCPIMIAPAMDLDMYVHPAVRHNLETMRAYGHTVLDAASGELASGLSGQGRMVEPEQILASVIGHFEIENDFINKKVLITSGPTQEAIDPVRFISNHSSGKMGAAIAEAFAKSGAEVHLVLGKGAAHPKHNKIKIYKVTSAQEMYDTCMGIHHFVDIAVFAAAVADYAPKTIAQEKIKKSDEVLTIEMVKNVDIAKELGELKRQHQIHVGFALETENEHNNAKRKLKKKNFDLIVLNSMREPGAGFQVDTNKVTLYNQFDQSITSELLPKSEIASFILRAIQELPKSI